MTDKENPADEDCNDKTKADAFEGAGIKVKKNSVLTIKGDGTIISSNNGIHAAYQHFRRRLQKRNHMSCLE